MSRRPAGFYSDGLRLDGELYLPDDLEPGERRPAIVTCSGYQGLKAIHPARFATNAEALEYLETFGQS